MKIRMGFLMRRSDVKISEPEKQKAASKDNGNNNNNNNSSGNGGDIEVDGLRMKHRTSKLEAATHFFKGSVGAGLFAMGDCFKNGGLVGSVLLLPVFAVICVHCECMLIRGSVYVTEKAGADALYDYPETVEKCFENGPRPLRRLSKLMRLVVEAFLFVTQFGFCSIYFVFITENLHQVLLQNGIDLGAEFVMSLALVAVLVPSLMTNLKYISPVSMLANVALIFGLVATLVLALKDTTVAALSERHYFTNGAQMALFFGTALFSYEGIALILPLRNSMREPTQFNSRFGVLNLSMTLITAVFVFTGFVSYVRWGEQVEGSITLNLDAADVLAQVIKIVAALGVFFGYPIQFYIMIKVIWPPMKQSMSCAQQYPVLAQVTLRFLMVLLTFGVALLVPKLGLFISLIGAMCSTCLAFLIPVVIDFVVGSQIPNALTSWVYLKNILIVLIAVLGIAMGTYQSIVEIVKQFHS